jgi:hypothetical protein
LVILGRPPSLPLRELLALAVRLMNMRVRPVRRLVRGRASLRVANAKTKADLGWRPTFPTYREGFRAMASPRAGGKRGWHP